MSSHLERYTSNTHRTKRPSRPHKTCVLLLSLPWRAGRISSSHLGVWSPSFWTAVRLLRSPPPSEARRFARALERRAAFWERELSSPPSPSVWIWLSVNSSPSAYFLPPERSVIDSAEAPLAATRRRSGAVASTSYCDASCQRKLKRTCRCKKKPVRGGLR